MLALLILNNKTKVEKKRSKNVVNPEDIMEVLKSSIKVCENRKKNNDET